MPHLPDQVTHELHCPCATPCIYSNPLPCKCNKETQLPTFISYSMDDYNSLYRKELMFIVHKKTGIDYLADTGSIPNLMRLSTLQTHYPLAGERRQTLNSNVYGIGGKQQLTYWTTIRMGKKDIPFATGPNIETNILGFTWYPVAMAQEETDTVLLTFREARLSMATESREPSLCLENSDGKRTGENEKEFFATPRDGADENGLINRKTSETSKLLASPAFERYVASLTENKVESLKQRLQKIKNNILEASTQKPLLEDFSSPHNEILTKSEWFKIYQPYKERLENLKENLRAKQTLKYPCSVELVTSNVKPVVNNPYQIRSKEQKKALEENIEKFLDFLDVQCQKIFGRQDK